MAIFVDFHIRNALHVTVELLSQQILLCCFVTFREGVPDITIRSLRPGIHGDSFVIDNEVKHTEEPIGINFNAVVSEALH